MTEPTDVPSNDVLMEFILSLLTPFLTTALTDTSLARRAAQQSIANYRAAGGLQLITVAQIVAFTLASLDSLRLSLPPDLPLPMKLKLRGSANALSRTAQKATSVLDTQRRDAQPERDPAEVLAALRTAKTEIRQAKAQPPEPTPPPGTTPAGTTPAGTTPAGTTPADLAWAGAMTEVATEFATELDTMSPAERQAQLARIAALSHIAGALGRGDGPALKAQLLGSTALKV